MKPEADGTTWLSQKERGALWLIRGSFFVATLFGRRFMKVPVAMVALWYRLFDRGAVRASQGFLRRVYGREPTWWEVYRHVQTFAQVTLDRIFLVKNRLEPFEFGRVGEKMLRDQMASGRGAVLLGAHLGSYEAMRSGGTVDDVPIHILGYFENAQMINALLEKVDPAHAARVLHLGRDPVGVMARVRGRIEVGDLVALLGDRVGLNDRLVEAEFFGERAAFPAGPFLLASLLKCPVYLTFGLYHPPRRYDLSCELFAERLEFPRATREQSLQAEVQRYASRLEDYCRRAPNNWFNFFDFWKTHERPPT